MPMAKDVSLRLTIARIEKGLREEALFFDICKLRGSASQTKGEYR